MYEKENISANTFGYERVHWPNLKADLESYLNSLKRPNERYGPWVDEKVVNWLKKNMNGYTKNNDLIDFYSTDPGDKAIEIKYITVGGSYRTSFLQYNKLRDMELDRKNPATETRRKPYILGATLAKPKPYSKKENWYINIFRPGTRPIITHTSVTGKKSYWIEPP